jgi:type IX secretion system PorP/SprF family membrane protein
LKNILYLSCLLVFFIPWSINAQDIHFSQFSYSPTNLNPALTGIFRGNVRVNAGYRSQWQAVPVDYETFTLGADLKLPNRNPESNGFWAAGATFNFDQAGYSNLQLINFNLNGSYTQKLTPHAFMTAGLQLGLTGRSFGIDGLLFDQNYDRNTSTGNANLDNGEDFPATNNTFGDVGVGLNLRLQDFGNCEIVNDLSKRNYLDVGIGVFHVNRPNQAFQDSDEELLPIRLSPYILGNLLVHDNADVFANANFQFQGPYREWLFSLGGRVYFDKTPGNQISVAASCGYRFNNELGDVVFPALEIQVDRIYGIFTYDINVSEFNAATRWRGGPEITFRYIIGKICLDRYFCPLL